LIRLLAIALALAVATPVFAQSTAPDPANTLVLELKGGKVLIRLRPDIAPKHVARVKQLAKEGFYTNLTWHRVISGFMAQSGDPDGTGRGGSKYGNVPAEFSPEVYKRGTVGAARTSNPDSANSQFFICFGSGCESLTGKYTIWGNVIEGMDAVDKITPGEPPATPDRILKAYLLADAPK
jgi:peptidylprolyl isomerase